MKTITVNLYTYDELIPTAQEKAREWWRSSEDTIDQTCTLDDAKNMGALMGFTITDVYYSGFSSQGDGACFEGDWRAGSVNLAALKAEAPQDGELHRICDGFDKIANDYPGAYFTVKHEGHYCHKYCTSFTCEPGDDLTDAQMLGFPEDTLVKLARDFMQWIYRQLEAEYEYQRSDEAVAETLIANGYTFTIDGKRYES